MLFVPGVIIAGVVTMLGMAAVKMTKDIFFEKSSIREPQSDILEYIVDTGTGCDIPYLDPFSKEIMDYVTEVPRFKCPTKDWVTCKLSKCRTKPSILERYDDVHCKYYDIIYHTDNHYTISQKAFDAYGKTSYTLEKSDHVEVECWGYKMGTRVDLWRGLASGLRKMTAPYAAIQMGLPEGLIGKKKRNDSLNILIFGFDSTSKNAFIRKMPRSYNLLKHDMNAVFMNKYNVVGDGTTAAFYAMLVGRTEQELPDTRKSSGDRKVDHKNLLFYKFKTDGYRTMYLEDMPTVGTFKFRHNGFAERPADHTLWDFFLEAGDTKDRTRDTAYYCMGEVPQYKFMMEKTLQFFKLDGKKFCVTFIADITHDDFNELSVADDDFFMFLQNFTREGHLQNTLVFIMSDHGYRSSQMNSFYQGKLETRLPLIAIIVPDVLKKKRPNINDALHWNAEVLTTPHDVHATILDAADKNSQRVLYKVKGSDFLRGLSLLKPITSTRSCGEAGIDPQWCACHWWLHLKPTESLYQEAADALVNALNNITLPFRKNECKKMSLHTIISMEQLRPRKEMLQFAKSLDPDGYRPMFSDIGVGFDMWHRVQIKVLPNNATYEAKMLYLHVDSKFVVERTNIVRTSKNEIERNRCLVHEDLVKYCAC